jgi:hypothetical protein
MGRLRSGKPCGVVYGSLFGSLRTNYGGCTMPTAEKLYHGSQLLALLGAMYLYEFSSTTSRLEYLAQR